MMFDEIRLAIAQRLDVVDASREDIVVRVRGMKVRLIHRSKEARIDLVADVIDQVTPAEARIAVGMPVAGVQLLSRRVMLLRTLKLAGLEVGALLRAVAELVADTFHVSATCRPVRSACFDAFAD